MARAAPATGSGSPATISSGASPPCRANIKGKVADRKQTLITSATVAATVLLLIVFLLGKRSGKRKTTLVEIRRV